MQYAAAAPPPSPRRIRRHISEYRCTAKYAKQMAVVIDEKSRFLRENAFEIFVLTKVLHCILLKYRPDVYTWRMLYAYEISRSPSFSLSLLQRALLRVFRVLPLLLGIISERRRYYGRSAYFSESYLHTYRKALRYFENKSFSVFSYVASRSLAPFLYIQCVCLSKISTLLTIRDIALLHGPTVSFLLEYVSI